MAVTKWTGLAAVLLTLAGCGQRDAAVQSGRPVDQARIREIVEGMPGGTPKSKTEISAESNAAILGFRVEETERRASFADDRLEEAEKKIEFLENEVSALEARVGELEH